MGNHTAPHLPPPPPHSQNPRLHIHTHSITMASTISASGLIPLKSVSLNRKSQRSTKVVARSNAASKAIVCKSSKAQVQKAVAAPAATLLTAAPAFAQTQEVMQLGMETNVLGLIATALFILIPTSFLIVLLVSSSASGNESGGYSQKYYDNSKKNGNKKTNLAAKMTGAGKGMYSDF